MGELNKLVVKMMDIVSKVIYAAIFLNVFKSIAGNSMETIWLYGGLWPPIMHFASVLGCLCSCILFISTG